MKQQGHPIHVIAAALRVNRRTLLRWSKQSLQRPPRARHRPNRRKLTSVMGAALFQHFSSHNTTTLKQVMLWLREYHAVSVTVKTVYNYFWQYNICF